LSYNGLTDAIVRDRTIHQAASRPRAEKTMAIQLTEAARNRMQDYLVREPSAAGVRFGIKKTGCSGFGYTVDVASAIADNDVIFDQDGVRILVDRKSLPFIDGTEIDFQRQGINATFVFRNPNATGECGCGESFTVAPAA
jgi:iron-sulfur cluster assembly protein